MKNNTKGFLLIEVLLSIVVLSMVVFSLFSMVGFLQRRTVTSAFESRAALLAQEATEIAHTYLLANWSLPDGVYSPVYIADTNSWEISPGVDTKLESLFDRVIHVSHVCRNPVTGDIIDEGKSSCSGVIDPYSKEVVTEVTWAEKSNTNSLRARLLVLNIPD